MQCHANVLDTTGTTYARQQPRYVGREKKRKKKKEKKGKRKYNIKGNIYPQNITK